jgi:twinkle protein
MGGNLAPHNKANFSHHEPCTVCGSRDANGVYDDGHQWCFSCETYQSGGEGSPAAAQEVPNKSSQKQQNLLQGEAKALPARGLTEADCHKFSYWVGLNHNGEHVQIANYRDASGKIVAQKVRGKDKSFQFIGATDQVTLFGQHLWSGKGKKLCLVEGELDAIALSSCFQHKYAVCSIPNGAAGAVRAVKRNFDYIVGFDECVICFDMDEVGQKAAQAVAEILPVGKAKIATLPAKDANEAILQGKQSELVQAVWQAKEFRPDGIKSAKDYRSTITVDEAASAITWPYSSLNEQLKGLHKETLTTICAGSGTGKTTFCKELIHHLLLHDQKVGVIALEESNKRTLLGLVGIHLSKNLLVEREQATDEEVLDGFDDLFGDRTCYLFDHFGSSDVDLICQRIQYMAKALDIQWVILDHISILVSAQEGDERRMLDAACTKLRTLCSQLGIGIIMVSHLRRPDGKGHEDGANVSLSQLRGSHAIAQLSDTCIGLQVDPEEPDSDIRHIKILKNRYTGQTGHAGTLVYNRETGRLNEIELSFLEGENDNDSEDE